MIADDINRIVQELFDCAEQISLFDTAERPGDSLASGASCPTDAVDVDFGFVGHIVVDNVCYAVDVDSACGDIAGDEHGHFALLELGESFLPGALCFV